MSSKIKLGMIGGGPAAMIGNIHRIAARMDNQYELTAGVFSRDYQKSLQLNVELELNLQRIYPSYQVLFENENLLPRNKRIEVVSIITPNESHFVIATLALQSGFHVIIDKPVTITSAQAKQIQTLAKQHNRLVCVTYTYTGYPMVKEARHFIQSNKLGNVRKVIVTFSQGWLLNYLHNNKKTQPLWRMNSPQNGGGTLMDIGTHAFHLAEYISNLKITDLCADVTLVKGPHGNFDDDSTILVKFENGAHGILMLSQTSAGEEVNINISIYGEKGSIHWSHQDPSSLVIKWLNKPSEIYRQGSDNAYLSMAARYHCRTPGGHPEGFLEAFANHYRNFAYCIKARQKNLNVEATYKDYPKIEAGLRGLLFVETALASTKSDKKWLAIE